MDAKLRVYRSRSGGDDWEPLTRGLPQSHCYVGILREAGIPVESEAELEKAKWRYLLRNATWTALE